MKTKKEKSNKKNRFSSFSTFGLGKERNYLIENLSTLVSSGMTIIEALDAINSDIKSKRLKKILNEMEEEIEAGSPLWKALSNTKLFSSHTVSLIQIGEESGRLSENLNVVSLQEQKDQVFRSKIRSAMMYPIFVLVLTLVIGTGIAWFILPKLSVVFSQLGLDLPLLTRILIASGLFLDSYGLIAVPIFFLLIFLFLFFLFFHPKTKRFGQKILFILPGIKRLIQEVELARFGYLLGTLLQAGLPVARSLESLADATYFPDYKRFFNYLSTSISEGNSFQKSFKNFKKLNKLIPTPVQQLLIASERSGNLPDTLLKISARYEEKTETTTKNLTVILEPILLVIVWLGVVGVALAVILPIYSLIGGGLGL